MASGKNRVSTLYSLLLITILSVEEPVINQVGKEGREGGRKEGKKEGKKEGMENEDEGLRLRSAATVMFSISIEIRSVNSVRQPSPVEPP